MPSKIRANMCSRGQFSHTKDTSWNLTFQRRHTSSIRHFTVCTIVTVSLTIVRHLEHPSQSVLGTLESPFTVQGARNVILETIKRGEDDKLSSDSSSTIILRLYEAFGGHAQARLRIADHLSIDKVHLTNLLEEETAELSVTKADDSASLVKIDFRGFEVKTVKLTLKKVKAEQYVMLGVFMLTT